MNEPSPKSAIAQCVEPARPRTVSNVIVVLVLRCEEESVVPVSVSVHLISQLVLGARSAILHHRFVCIDLDLQMCGF